MSRPRSTSGWGAAHRITEAAKDRWEAWVVRRQAPAFHRDWLPSEGGAEGAVGDRDRAHRGICSFRRSIHAAVGRLPAEPTSRECVRRSHGRRFASARLGAFP